MSYELGHSGGNRDNGRRPSSYWSATLRRRIADTLVLSHWDVEPYTQSDGQKIDFVLRRNLRRPKVARPIVIHATTRLDQRDSFLGFLDAAEEKFGPQTAFLYIESEITRPHGREELAFDEIPVVAAVSNIVSFFSRPNDPNIFRLRMARGGNSFRRVPNPESEFESTGSDGYASEGDDEAPIEGVLTAWKVMPHEPHKEYGWIEDHDGGKYNAYWRAFSKTPQLNELRDFANSMVGEEGDWVELNVPVRFEIEPPQRYGQHPRAVEIDLLGEIAEAYDDEEEGAEEEDIATEA